MVRLSPNIEQFDGDRIGEILAAAGWTNPGYEANARANRPVSIKARLS
jgi:hypothetical protein